MRDRRSVDDLTIEELEQILRLKKRQARMDRLRRFEQVGKRRADMPLEEEAVEPAPEAEPAPQTPALQTTSYHDNKPRRGRSIRDLALLAIEIGAAVGLIVLLGLAAQTLMQINADSQAALAEQVSAIPTIEPTPLISAVVLPGGHTPPTSPGGAQPNYSEVPAAMRPLVEQQFAGPVLIPTAAPNNAIRIRIPAIGVDAPVVQGDGWEQLQKGVGQHIGTANPGTLGNVVLSAHNDIYGEIFRRLDELAPGDEIIVSTSTVEYIYRVADTRIVSPTDVSVMAPTQESVITLISCYPYLVNTERIVVIGELAR